MDLDAQRGERILEERKRLGWSQQIAADTAGIRREMWARYEAGSEPGAKALTGMATAGVDVLYILTGQRSGVAAAAPVVAEPPATQLSRRALAVAQNYEATSEEGKKIIEAAAFAAAQPAPGRGAKVA